MKRAIGWTLSWACFWVGDVASRIIGQLDPQAEWLQNLCYWCYSKPMLLSSRLQDWGGTGPWEIVKHEPENKYLHHD